MKNNDEKIIIKFFSMHCDVHYYHVILKLNFNLCMEKQKDKLHYEVK